MLGQTLPNPRTAPQNLSIWQNLPEDLFRQHMVKLEEYTNAIPIEPQIFQIKVSDPNVLRDGHILPLVTEQRVANAFALIAAVEEGAQSVSAVCLEECSGRAGLIIRFAAVDTINASLKATLLEITKIMSAVCQASRQNQKESEADILFALIVESHHRRLLGRLRSQKWRKPAHLIRSHKKPLWQDFDNLVHRAQFIYTKTERKLRLHTESQIQGLALLYHSFESTTAGSEAEQSHLRDLVKSSYVFCTSELIRVYASRLSDRPNATDQIASAIKSLQQIEKIAAYWRISLLLVDTAEKYDVLFKNITLEYLSPYANVPTAIAYEPWAKVCHVHAEIQLAVFYDGHCSTTGFLPPRAVGTSKYLCYLCFLFLTHHGHFYVSSTHGRLYDQWTIPDLVEYNETQRELYRGVIYKMDEDILSMTNLAGEGLDTEEKVNSKQTVPKKFHRVVEPMTSRENLLLIPLEDLK